MRVATANCEHWPQTAVLARALAHLDADVLGLQEVDRFAYRTRFASQVARVAGAAGPGHTSAWVWGEPMGPFGVLGLQGVGLVVRGQIVDRQRLRLPRLPRPAGERVAPLTGGHKRIALLARARPASGPALSVAVAHLAVSRPEAEAQLAAVIAALLDRPAPHLLLADVNLPVEEAALGHLVAARPGPTFPRSAPKECIDLVAATGLTLGPARSVDLGCSDHLAVAADLDDVAS
jgi:endonuclease/exonuclease/phosphatase family metal-dependent hydrolase